MSGNQILQLLHLNWYTPTKMPAEVCKKICECIGREKDVRYYQCETCKNLLEEPAQFFVTYGTNDARFKRWSFCCYEHYIQFLKG